jgi:hypothetical protein
VPEPARPARAVRRRLRVGTRREFGPGAHHLAHRGSLHATIGTDTGATLSLRGGVPEASHVPG